MQKRSKLISTKSQQFLYLKKKKNKFQIYITSGKTQKKRKKELKSLIREMEENNEFA